jgi:hypothetical protein
MKFSQRINYVLWRWVYLNRPDCYVPYLTMLWIRNSCPLKKKKVNSKTLRVMWTTWVRYDFSWWGCSTRSCWAHNFQAEKYMIEMMGFKTAQKRIECMIYKQQFKGRVHECKVRLYVIIWWWMKRSVVDLYHVSASRSYVWLQLVKYCLRYR